MTPQQIKTALKIHQLAAEKEADFESIATQLGLDIEGMALQIVSEPSPTNRRQTVRKVNAPSMKGSIELPSFNLNMMKRPMGIGGSTDSNPAFPTSSKSGAGGASSNPMSKPVNSVRNNLKQ